MQTVAIEIQDDPSQRGALVIKINPYCLEMPAKRPNEKIKFALASTAFRFVGDPNRAVKVERNTGQFSGNANGQGPDRGKVVTVDNKNTDSSLYKYSIAVEDQSGQMLSIDPLIKNNG